MLAKPIGGFGFGLGFGAGDHAGAGDLGHGQDEFFADQGAVFDQKGGLRCGRRFHE